MRVVQQPRGHMQRRAIDRFRHCGCLLRRLCRCSASAAFAANSGATPSATASSPPPCRACSMHSRCCRRRLDAPSVSASAPPPPPCRACSMHSRCCPRRLTGPPLRSCSPAALPLLIRNMRLTSRRCPPTRILHPIPGALPGQALALLRLVPARSAPPWSWLGATPVAKVPAARDFMERHRYLWDAARANLLKAQADQKKYAVSRWNLTPYRRSKERRQAGIPAVSWQRGTGLSRAYSVTASLCTSRDRMVGCPVGPAVTGRLSVRPVPQAAAAAAAGTRRAR
jgi:hypothetical protein